MPDVQAYIRPNGEQPYDSYVESLRNTGNRGEAAKIEAVVDLLESYGTQQLVRGCGRRKR